jgi:hypothetical protein
VIRNLVIAAVVGALVASLMFVVFGPSTPKNVVAVQCKDSTNDYNTLSKAINNSNPGDQILISGTCKLTHSLVLLGSRSYTGSSSAGTVLETSLALRYVVANDSFVRDVDIPGRAFTLSNLAIQCNGAGVGLWMRAAQSVVENVRVRGCSTAGIEDTNLNAHGRGETQPSDGNLFTHLQIDDCTEGFVVTDNGNTGRVINSTLSNSTFGTSKKTAIDLDDASGWTVEGNHMFQDGGDGIFASRMYSTQILNNRIEDFAYIGSRAAGLDLEIQPDATAQVSGNQINNQNSKGTGSYIKITTTGAAASIAYAGNVIAGNGTGTGLTVDTATNGGTLDIADAGNVVLKVNRLSNLGKGVTIHTH